MDHVTSRAENMVFIPGFVLHIFLIIYSIIGTVFQIFLTEESTDIALLFCVKNIHKFNEVNCI